MTPHYLHTQAARAYSLLSLAPDHPTYMDDKGNFQSTPEGACIQWMIQNEWVMDPHTYQHLHIHKVVAVDMRHAPQFRTVPVCAQCDAGPQDPDARGAVRLLVLFAAVFFVLGLLTYWLAGVAVDRWLR